MTKLIFFSLFLTFTVYADEAYQTKNVLGDWYSLDESSFKYYGLRIASENSVTKLLYCDLWKLKFTGECQKTLKYEGSITYTEAGDSLLVNEGMSSPTPSYRIKVNETNPDKLLRDCGPIKIEYFRVR